MLLFPLVLSAQQKKMLALTRHWEFFYPVQQRWLPATVPGTIHTDLQDNHLIPDPYYRDNEKQLQWIGEANWQYRLQFDVPPSFLKEEIISLQFQGLDTWADVILNGHLILQADNMFRGWTVNVRPWLLPRKNKLEIHFTSAVRKTDSLARVYLPLVLPDNNRVFARKAQYHFGWDWGPTFITCGIWQPVILRAGNTQDKPEPQPVKSWQVKLVQEKDSYGTSFCFEKAGTPVYCKGANWIPGEVFLPRLKREDYRQQLLLAKNAHMNMLRVWGGGIYETEDFYSLCDSLGIMVWQDFMFAGGMVPGDAAFFDNVREEVKYQLQRLSRHPCIVLWCGNNEIDEAWHNWGWQQQFNLHGADSAKIWNDYRRLFEDSLPRWVAAFDEQHRPYVSTSPRIGWGHARSFTEGDSHYWGVWWGLEDWEVFRTKTGRFVSEYGMQSMPNWKTVEGFTLAADRQLSSAVIQHHQKANNGFGKLAHYLQRYFIDSGRLYKLSLADYTYLTQCLQYYILKNSIAEQRSQYPKNKGTLLWQLNDCWPVCSWSITDYSRQPKAAWYAVREAYRDDHVPVTDSVAPKDLPLKKAVVSIRVLGNDIILTSNEDAKFVELSVDGNTAVFSDNYFDLKKNIPLTVKINHKQAKKAYLTNLRVKTLYDVLYN